MGRVVGPPIAQGERKWIQEQKIFFHASAPLGRNHRINLSPKSASQFRVVNDNTVAWLDYSGKSFFFFWLSYKWEIWYDYSGSGSETAAHLMENGRLTIMFVAFSGDPKIVRLYGRGLDLILGFKCCKNYFLCIFDYFFHITRFAQWLESRHDISLFTFTDEQLKRVFLYSHIPLFHSNLDEFLMYSFFQNIKPNPNPNW